MRFKNKKKALFVPGAASYLVEVEGDKSSAVVQVTGKFSKENVYGKITEIVGACQATVAESL
jgi:hypothetical protein